MIVSGNGRNALIICASVLAIAALYFARSVFAPAAVSLFAVAVVWPVQKWLEERLPQLIALAITLLLTVFVLSALLTLSVWGIGQVGRWMIINAAQVQAFYVQLTQWLESHGIFVVGIFLDRFDVAWLVRPAQGLASTVRTLVAFALLVLVFMMLALLEVRDFKAKLQTACPEEFASRILRASKLVAEKFRRYMVIRTDRKRCYRAYGRAVMLGAWDRASGSLGRLGVRAELRPIHRAVRGDGSASTIRHRPVSILGGSYPHLCRRQPYPVLDRQLSRAALVRERTFDLSVSCRLRGLLRRAAVGDFRCVHGGAAGDRRSHAPAAVHLHRLDRRAAVGHAWAFRAHPNRSLNSISVRLWPNADVETRPRHSSAERGEAVVTADVYRSSAFDP